MKQRATAQTRAARAALNGVGRFSAWLSLGAILACSSLDAGSDTAAKVYGFDATPSSAGAGGSDDSPPLPPEWACLETPTVPVTQEPGRVTYVVAIVDFDSQPYSPTIVKNLDVQVCGSPSCDPPASEPDVVIHHPVEGQPPFVYAIELPFGFSNGSLRLTAPNYAPMDYVFNGPMIGAPEGGYRVQGLTIPLLKATTRDTIYHDLGLPGEVDLSRGVLAMRMLNCLRDPKANPRAPGVKLEAVPSAPPAPAVAWSLSTSNRATPARLETDSRGVAGFVNVLPLVYDVQGITPGGQAYGRTSVAVRPGVITLAEIRDGIGRWGQ